MPIHVDSYADKLSDISHRAAAKAEIDLGRKFSGPLICIEHYCGIKSSEFMADAGQGVQA